MNSQPGQLLAPNRRRSISDPLSAALLPPPNESPEERERRLSAEAEAKKRSDNIDKMLREGERQNRRKKVVKVLLLGQSESGKSTTLKQFQLLHARAAFQAERIAWRFVIYLNLLQSVRRILEAISPDADVLANGLDEIDDYDGTDDAASIIICAPGGSTPSYGTQVPNYESYRTRLAPLAELEARLIQQLSDPEDIGNLEATRLPLSQNHQAWPYNNETSPTSTGWGQPIPRISIPSGSRSSPASPTSLASMSNHQELTVPTTFNWKKAFALGKIQSPKSAYSGGELQGWWEDPDDPVHVLHRCSSIIVELWRDPKVTQKLKEKRLRLEESSGFYLNEIDRITAKMYIPTDDDILKARLKTTGVVEHTFTMPKDNEFRGVDWKIYDVGGARPQRNAWVPYFDDVNAIIFLAPISAFDQVLAEDSTVNRLEDSMHLWKHVVSNRLLANVNIILFLNKCDLLRSKLESGVRISHHIRGYSRPNDYDSVSKYFYNKFGAIHQSYTPNRSRELYIHLTAVTDTRRTQVIILNVRDMILTANLKSSSLM